ncbi:hypothetical protein H6G89_15945 [Oscillatoria sp. FACHB-1407]|nr:hypothetical protein [Oscillatoria sp. FACHB-1407]
MKREEGEKKREKRRTKSEEGLEQHWFSTNSENFDYSLFFFHSSFFFHPSIGEAFLLRELVISQ